MAWIVTSFGSYSQFFNFVTFYECFLSEYAFRPSRVTAQLASLVTASPVPVSVAIGWEVAGLK